MITNKEIKVKWAGIEFKSLAEFSRYHGYKVKGSFQYYRKWGIPFKGHKIITD